MADEDPYGLNMKKKKDETNRPKNKDGKKEKKKKKKNKGSDTELLNPLTDLPGMQPHKPPRKPGDIK